MVCMWLREIFSCSCLPVLPGPVWVLLSKIYRPFLGALYILSYTKTAMHKPLQTSRLAVQLPHGVGGGLLFLGGLVTHSRPHLSARLFFISRLIWVSSSARNELV